MRKLLSGFLVAILVPLIWAQIGALTARDLTMNPEYTKGVISRSGLYQQLERHLADQLAKATQQPDSIQFTRAEAGQIVGRVMPAARVQVLAETALDGFYAWFRAGGSTRPNVVLDLRESRAAVKPALRDVLMAKVEALPVCTAAQTLELAVRPSRGMPPCKSPDARVNQAMVERSVEESGLDQMIPERLDLAALLEQGEGEAFWSSLATPVDLTRRSLDRVTMGWYLIGGVIAALAALNLSRWYAPFGWVATPLLIGGGSTYLLGWVGVSLALPMIEEFAAQADSGSALAAAFGRLLVEIVATAMRNNGLMVSLGGIGALAVHVAGRLISGGGTSARQPAA